MSAVLELRRAIIVAEDPLTVAVNGFPRPAWADSTLLGEMRAGDEVVVNVAGLDRELGSGGFDVVHVNLTRGIGAAAAGDAHVMKLNYTSLQHAVKPVEQAIGENRGGRTIPVLIIPLHGHLAPAAWAASTLRPGSRTRLYPDRRWRPARLPLGRRGRASPARPAFCPHHRRPHLRRRARGAEHGWGSRRGGARTRLGCSNSSARARESLVRETHLGHGGLAALDTAHAALSLGMGTSLSPRLSAGDFRGRHRGVSHHTRTVLGLLLAPAASPFPRARRRSRLSWLGGRGAPQFAGGRRGSWGLSRQWASVRNDGQELGRGSALLCLPPCLGSDPRRIRRRPVKRGPLSGTARRARRAALAPSLAHGGLRPKVY